MKKVIKILIFVLLLTITLIFKNSSQISAIEEVDKKQSVKCAQVVTDYDFETIINKKRNTNKKNIFKIIDSNFASEDLFEVKDVNNGVEIVWYSGLGGDITIPEHIENKKVVSIGWKAFYEKVLTSVTLPNGIKEIDDWAFANNNINHIYLPEGLKKIGAYAFTNNRLNSVIIPESVIDLGEASFMGNVLNTINVPKGISEVKNWTFGSNKITSIALPKTLLRIGENAFAWNQITSIDIPDNVEIIGDWAFSRNQLQEIKIPKHITTINEGVFF